MLDAAAAVVLKQGVTKLTLDAVAKEAGVSKGGVMYNFPTKRALVAALVERLIEGHVQASAETSAKLPAGPTRELKSYVKNSLDDPRGYDRISGALMATVSNDPELVERLRLFFETRFAEISSGLDFERTAIVHLATEGLWFLELLRVSPFTPQQRARLATQLLKMSDESIAQ